MKIKKILINFVWHGKAHLVSQDVCHLPLKQGGLALPDFCKKLTALYLSYLKEFDDDCLVDWNYTFRFFLGQYLENLIPLPFSSVQFSLLICLAIIQVYTSNT